MNPVPYTVKSLAGPVLFVIAAYLYGQSVGRRSAVSLSGLPKTGRIPIVTAKRALKSLGRKATACRITPAALREGMEVEREHRDVTRGGVLKTAKIAAAHLCEKGGSRYYKELKKVERKLKRGK
jgi:hypothetical protein